MITLKTTTQFQIPFGRIFLNEYVYLTIERLDIDINNVTPIGFYYFMDEVGTVHKLDDIVRNPILWDDINTAEVGMLPILSSTTSLKSNLLQRLAEFTLIKLEMEGNTNYGTTVEDWVII